MTEILNSPRPLAANDNPREEAIRVASEMFRQSPDWVTFFREVLGVDGVVKRLFPNPADLTEFEKSSEYVEIQQMLTRLRTRTRSANETEEATKVITVRMPQSLHRSLCAEAEEMNVSVNKLCISKLIRIIDEDLIPRRTHGEERPEDADSK